MLKKITLLLVLLATFVGGLLSDKLVTPRPSVTSSAIYPSPTPLISSSNLMFYVNQYRTTQNLPSLEISDLMCQIANTRITEIPTDWSHNGFWPLYNSNHLSGWYGENLSRDFYPAQNVLLAWIESPEHKANLDNPHYTHTCIAISGTYVVMEYGQ